MAGQAAVLCDLVGPYQGACGLCGADDARHRVVDAILVRVDAGDPPEECAADYGLPPGDVVRLVELAGGVTA